MEYHETTTITPKKKKRYKTDISGSGVVFALWINYLLHTKCDQQNLKYMKRNEIHT